MKSIEIINTVIAIVFTLCYAYQFLYIPVVWFKKRKPFKTEAAPHNFAVLICARNEETVIRDLINSIKAQDYPSELVSIFVLADNCTDKTAQTAESAGATVYERIDNAHIGKGYALDALLSHIKYDYPEGFDGYFVFDADNILTENYITEMNKTFSDGNDIVTSYRNSKNYGSNWISAGYALWFLRESRYLNYARSLLGVSCCVSGTGFLFSRRIADELDGWHFHTLTEDIEFSAYNITRGRKIAFCENAEFYDEQPVLFRQSWRQRMRWSRGYLQVFGKYGKKLLSRITVFSCFDMSMTIMPAFVLSAMSIITNTALLLCGSASGFLGMLLNMYLVLFCIGLITTVTEWKHIHTGCAKKLFYTLTFPLFMFTYIPISIAALFCKPGWKPIVHSFTVGRPSRF